MDFFLIVTFCYTCFFFFLQKEHRILYMKRLDLDSCRTEVKKAQQDVKLQQVQREREEEREREIESKGESESQIDVTSFEGKRAVI